MENIRNQLRKRNYCSNAPAYVTSGVAGKYGKIIAQDRIEKAQSSKVINSFFNHSMWIYFLLVSADIILWIIYEIGI